MSETSELSVPRLGRFIAESEELILACLLLLVRAFLSPLEGTRWLYRDRKYWREWRIEWACLGAIVAFFVWGTLSVMMIRNGNASLMHPFLAAWAACSILGLLGFGIIALMERLLNET